MFASTLELIALAASNSLCVFCICNLIIVVLLVSGTKPTPDDDEDRGVANLETIHPDKSDEEIKEAYLSEEKPTPDDDEDRGVANPETIYHDKSGKEIKEVYLSKETAGYTGDNRVKIGDEIDEEDGNENEEDGEELRRRVEEFIEKVNRGWKEEKLRTYHLEIGLAVATA